MGNSLITLTKPTLFIEEKDVRTVVRWTVATVLFYSLTLLAMILFPSSAVIVAGVVLMMGFPRFPHRYISPIIDREKHLRGVIRQSSLEHAKASLDADRTAMPSFISVLSKNSSRFTEEKIAEISVAQLDKIGEIYDEEILLEVDRRKAATMEARKQLLADKENKKAQQKKLNRLESIGSADSKRKELRALDEGLYEIDHGQSRKDRAAEIIREVEKAQEAADAGSAVEANRRLHCGI